MTNTELDELERRLREGSVYTFGSWAQYNPPPPICVQIADALRALRQENSLLADHLMKAQHALQRWLPKVRGDGSALDEQAANDAILLSGLTTNQALPEYGERMRAVCEAARMLKQAQDENARDFGRMPKYLQMMHGRLFMLLANLEATDTRK